MSVTAPKYPWLGLIVLLVVCFAAAGIGGAVTTPKIATWYAALAKPSWNPPNWIFGPVWSVLYLCMAIAATMVAFWFRSAIAGILFVPYLAWVSFAAALNFTLWRLNP